MVSKLSIDQKEINEIIDFINKRYDEEVPRPVKFVVRRKAKKLETLKVDDFPESFRRCTIEQLIQILNQAYKDGRLNF